jgi:uncharacterized protein (DUF433 family)
VALEQHRIKGIVRGGKVELEPGANVPDGIQVTVVIGDDLGAIRSTPGVMGGDACVRGSRIPVWMLVEYKQQGLSDSELLYNFPSLTAADLTATWDYFASHTEEVEAQRRRHEEAA